MEVGRMLGYSKMIQLLFVFFLITIEDAEVEVNRRNGRPGDTIIVPCKTAGLDAIQLKWLKDGRIIVKWDKNSGKPVYPNKEDEVKYTVDTSYDLTIVKADFTDDGKYTCRFQTKFENGTLRNNTETTEVKVSAHCDPPQTDAHVMYIPMKDAYGEGEIVKFRCNTSYSLSKNITVACVPSGHGSAWSSKPPTCHADQVGVQDGTLVAIIVPSIVGVMAVVVVIIVAFYKARRRRPNTTDDETELNGLSERKRDEEESFIDTNANTESEELEDTFLLEIGQEIGTQYIDLGTHLKLKQSTLEFIRENHKHNTEQVGFQVLMYWKRQQIEQQRDLLEKALKKMKRKDLAKRVQNYAPKTSCKV